jgi:hypothetical protein
MAEMPAGVDSRAARDPQKGLPAAAIIYMEQAGLPEELCGFPAMGTAAAAEDDGLAQVAQAADIDLQAVNRNIEGMGDMSLVEFIRGPKVDNNGSLLQCLAELAGTESKNFR